MVGTMSPAVSNRQKRHLNLCFVLLPDDNPYVVNNCLNMIIGFYYFLYLQFLQSINLSGTQAKPKIISVLRESDPKSRQLHFMDFNVSAVTCIA